MQLTKAEPVEGGLFLGTTPVDAMKFSYKFKAGNYDIVPHVEKRSDRSNRYAWELIGKLAKALDETPEAVYRHEIEGIGGVHDAIAINKDAAEAFIRAFKKGHKGRLVELVGEDEKTGKLELLLTYGSSDYDQKQMTQFIDHIVQDCRMCGIETEDPGYIKALLEA